ncbi:hypothetical protein INR49_022225 [Caranx melampygus]|nr:hypothetical protein INR49_022225 [Caranx melampygus]
MDETSVWTRSDGGVGDSTVFKTIDGAHLDCVLRRHPALASMMHLLPENVLVSGDEDIPGLWADVSISTLCLLDKSKKKSNKNKKKNNNKNNKNKRERKKKNNEKTMNMNKKNNKRIKKKKNNNNWIKCNMNKKNKKRNNENASPELLGCNYEFSLDDGDALLRPQLLKMLPFTLNRLTISLQPSLEKFESQLLQLINADCHNTRFDTAGLDPQTQAQKIEGVFRAEVEQTVVASVSSLRGRKKSVTAADRGEREKKEDSEQEEKQPGPEGTARTVVIQERRLHVGVHNGWCFLDKPQVVVMEPVASGARGRADSTSRQSTLVKDRGKSLKCSSAPSSRESAKRKKKRRSAPPRDILALRSMLLPVVSAGPSLPQVLGLRSSLQLKMTNHRALAVVFQLEYVFSAPVGRETMCTWVGKDRSSAPELLDKFLKYPQLSVTSSSRAAFLQCIRWAIWCPFQEPADWRGEQIQLVLQGGAKPNPHGVMVYSTEMSANTQSLAPPSAPGSAQVKDTITLRLSSGLEGKASSPKASLRMKQESVSRQRLVPAASPPDSPQGPGLSLSQLAATSRYPTISHSSSALLWQQSFPSLLHPSPLASAHQLSHVLDDNKSEAGVNKACSAVSNIAHLEMDLQREEDVSPSAQNEGEQLQELPFTPVHAPVITLGMNVPSSCLISSRSSLAHLYSAGFPQIVDHGGQVAEVLDPTEPMPFDPQREETDLLQGNLLVFQFLAFTRIPAAGVGADWPDNVHFTFHFYRFPSVTTQQLKLLTSDKVQHKTADPLPCVLASINKDGTVNSGLQVQFRVDDSFLRPGERRWFLRYLALHTMHIDIWDSDSLLLIGSTAIELKYMLRQGKPAVQALHEVEVLTTDYVGEDTLLTSAGLGQHSAAGPMTVHTIIRGRLHIRTGNVVVRIIRVMQQ